MLLKILAYPATLSCNVDIVISTCINKAVLIMLQTYFAAADLPYSDKVLSMRFSVRTRNLKVPRLGWNMTITSFAWYACIQRPWKAAIWWTKTSPRYHAPSRMAVPREDHCAHPIHQKFQEHSCPTAKKHRQYVVQCLAFKWRHKPYMGRRLGQDVSCLNQVAAQHELWDHAGHLAVWLLHLWRK